MMEANFMGPLKGIKVIEIASIGPGPFCGMMLSDMGAEVIRVNRVDAKPGTTKEKDILARNRRTIAVDLKRPGAAEVVLRLSENADAIFEGFRPGTTERLGIGPKHCMARNPKIVYGHMTGWGQTGPLAMTAGHDINFISISGALHAIGRKGERPVPPLNLVGDFGGGGLMLAFGLVCGILEAQKSGKGQVVDVSMVEGSAVLMAMFFGHLAGGTFSVERGTNLLDSGAHFYDVYETKDGKYISIGAIEPKFYRELLQKMGIGSEQLGAQLDKTRWASNKEIMIRAFKTKTQDEWCTIMEGSDTCFAPVLSIAEAPNHLHNKSRGTFVEIDGVLQAAPAPRFDRTVPEIRHAGHTPGQDTDSVLADNGFSEDEIASLKSKGIVAVF
jgi:alpha-methylacyl-CoA racemase